MSPLILVQFILLFGVMAAFLTRYSLYRKVTGYADLADERRVRGLNENERSARFIYAFGRKKPKRIGDMALFETTPGVRIVPPLLFVLLNYLLIRDMGRFGLEAWISFVLFILGGGYLMLASWKTRIILDGENLHKLDWRFRHQTYPLADLIAAEEDGAGFVRLEFLDGRAAFFTQYLNGYTVLKDYLIHTLEENRKR